MKRSIAVVLLLITLVTLAMAHGNEQHVMGTVSKISGNQITVLTIKHQEVTVTVTGKTEFANGNVKASLADLKVGDRVVIHAMKMGSVLQAHEVKFAASVQAGAAQARKR